MRYAVSSVFSGSGPQPSAPAAASDVEYSYVYARPTDYRYCPTTAVSCYAARTCADDPYNHFRPALWQVPEAVRISIPTSAGGSAPAALHAATIRCRSMFTQSVHELCRVTGLVTSECALLQGALPGHQHPGALQRAGRHIQSRPQQSACGSVKGSAIGDARQATAPP